MIIDRIRAAWRALMGTTALTIATPVVDEPAGISNAALWEARRTGRPAPDATQTFTPAKPMPGIIPESGMAMDAGMPAVQGVVSWAVQGAYHEGLAFLGFPYLAELAQRSEYRHATEIWAEHATRKFVKLTGDDEKVAELHKELARLKIADAFEQMSNHDGNFGRAHLFLDFGDADRDAETVTPLVIDARKISPQRPLQRVTVVEPMWVYPAQIDARNPLASTFYQPQAWYVYGRTVHASRLLTLIGREVPNMLKPSYAFGGLSLTQMMKPYVDNWLRTRQSVSDLVHAFSTMVLATDMEQVLTSADDGADLYRRVDMFNQTRDNRGTMVIDKNTETLDNVSVPLSGLEKLQAQAQEQLASVSRIPLSIYLQITPTGLNASSEGENRSFYADVNGYKEKKYRPLLKPLLDIIMLSLWSKIEDIGIEFEPLWEMSDVERATIRKTDADTDAVLIGSGVIDAEESRDRLKNDEASPFYGITGAAPEPEEDDEEEPPLSKAA